MKTLTEQLACVRRELALRKNVYPNWVRNGRMTRDGSGSGNARKNEKSGGNLE